jgi:EPS-associated MarR family transcriptional regulator
LLEAQPEISQRQLAKNLGVSLGKVNFCLKALIDIGLIKASNFRNSQNKLAYIYLLTPTGIEAKSSITLRFLKSKMQEYELLQAEISILMQEADTEFTLNQKPVTNIVLSSPTLTAEVISLE